MSPTQSPWPDLPPELIRLITVRLPIADYASFRCICRAWRSAASAADLPPQLPLLLLPSIHSESRILFSFSTGRYHSLHLPEAHGKRIRGAGHGWLFMTDNSTGIFSLLQPLTRSLIPLPPSGIDINDIISVFLSADPSSPSGCTVAVSHDPRFSSCLALCRVTSCGWCSSWTTLPIDWNQCLTYHKEKIYGFHREEGLTIYSIGPPATTRIRTITPPGLPPMRDQELKFLFESAGELLLALFYRGGDYGEYQVVYRLDNEDENPRWVAAGNIGNRALFHYSFRECNEILCCAIPTGDLNGFCRGNCLYQVNELDEDRMEVREFDLENHNIKELQKESDPLELILSWPALFIPKLVGETNSINVIGALPCDLAEIKDEQKSANEKLASIAEAAKGEANAYIQMLSVNSARLEAKVLDLDSKIEHLRTLLNIDVDTPKLLESEAEESNKDESCDSGEHSAKGGIV